MTAMLLGVVLKVTAVLLLALAATVLLKRHSAAARHWVLAVGLVCAAAMPLLVLVTPQWGVPGERFIGPPAPTLGDEDSVTFTIVTAPSSSTEPEPVGAAAPSSWTLGALALGIWAAGALAGIVSLAAGLIRLRELARGARPAPAVWMRHSRRIAGTYGVRAPVAWRETAHHALLVTWGVRRPEVLLPAGAAAWPDERVHSVAAHELAHIARSDWAAQVAAEVFRALLWWHPLAWLVVERLRLESEKACDDRVLALGVPRTAYAGHLVDVAHAFRPHSRPSLPALAVARPSTLQKRIRAMLNTHLHRQPLSLGSRAGVALLMALATLSLAGATTQPTGLISGVVVDPTGRHVAGVALVLVDVGRPFRSEIASGEDGAFEFAGLRAGTYRLETRHPGFGPVDDVLSLNEAGVIQHQVTLRVGTLRETITVTGPAAPGRQTASVPRQAPSPCTPSTDGGHIVPPLKVRDVRPVYPAGGVEAPVTVSLDARIGFDGQVNSVRVTSPTPPELGRAATDAVSRWEFTPTLLNCEPVEVSMTVTVTFTPGR